MVGVLELFSLEEKTQLNEEWNDDGLDSKIQFLFMHSPSIKECNVFASVTEQAN